MYLRRTAEIFYTKVDIYLKKWYNIGEGERNMTFAEMTIKVPVQMAAYLQPETNQEELQRNAMIMYPYVKSGMLSHGRVAQILGIKKWDLIELYNSFGLPYLSGISDFEDDLKTIDELKEII